MMIVVCIAIQNNKNLSYLDPILSFLMIIVMSITNLPVISNCISILLVEIPMTDKLKRKIESIHEVVTVTDIFMEYQAGGDEVLNVEVIAKNTSDPTK
jgi:Co/Zn/Cd efflux system component